MQTTRFTDQRVTPEYPERLYQVTYVDGRKERFVASRATHEDGFITIAYDQAYESKTVMGEPVIYGKEVVVFSVSADQVDELRLVVESPRSIWTVLRAATVKAARFI